MITTILLTKNHEDLIPQTLNSVCHLGPVLVADLGSDDGTVAVCEKHGASVFKSPFRHDYSIVRNAIAAKADTEWLLWLDPGEEVTSGHDILTLEKTDPMYRVMVLKDDLLTKEPRLVRKDVCRFIRPVFEGVEDVSEQTLSVVISGQTRQDLGTMMECLVKWKEKEPLSPDPDYYAACLYLMEKKYDQFFSQAEHFLFSGKGADASVALTKYYMALLLRKREVGKAVRLILECLAMYPLMAEFWCMLGDMYLSPIKEYERAYLFYENAIILGSRRLAEDTMPMEISKYDEYPRKIMDAIKIAIAKT